MLLPQAASRATALVASLLLALTACAQVQPSSPTAPLTSPSATGPEPSASPIQSPSPEPVPSPPSGPLVTGLPTPWPSDYVTGKPIEQRLPGPEEGRTHSPNTTDRIVLTFDDCPRSLDEFKETVTGVEALGVRVVLFALGNCVQQGKIDVDFARQHGMFVYSHSFNHPQFTKISDAAIRKQLSPPSVQGAWVRPPYGATNKHVQQVIESMGMQIWLWDFDTEDWRGKPQDQVVQEVVQYAQAGETVLMHMQWHASNVQAIAEMKKGLEARGLELCRIDGPATADGPFTC